MWRKNDDEKKNYNNKKIRLAFDKTVNENSNSMQINFIRPPQSVYCIVHAAH